MSTVNELQALNQHHELAVAAVRSLVLDWEQRAHDARLREDFQAASQYSAWAFAADLAASTVSCAFSRALWETYKKGQRPTPTPVATKSHTEVTLPDVTPVLTPEVVS